MENEKYFQYIFNADCSESSFIFILFMLQSV